MAHLLPFLLIAIVSAQFCNDQVPKGFFSQTGTLVDGIPDGFVALPATKTISACDLAALNEACVSRINEYRANRIPYSDGTFSDHVPPAALTVATGSAVCSNEEALGDLVRAKSLALGCSGAHFTFGSCGERGQNSCCTFGFQTTVADATRRLFDCLQQMWDEGIILRNDPAAPFGTVGHYLNMKNAGSNSGTCSFAWDIEGRLYLNQNFFGAAGSACNPVCNACGPDGCGGQCGGDLCNTLGTGLNGTTAKTVASTFFFALIVVAIVVLCVVAYLCPCLGDRVKCLIERLPTNAIVPMVLTLGSTALILTATFAPAWATINGAGLLGKTGVGLFAICPEGQDCASVNDIVVGKFMASVFTTVRVMMLLAVVLVLAASLASFIAVFKPNVLPPIIVKALPGMTFAAFTLCMLSFGLFYGLLGDQVTTELGNQKSFGYAGGLLLILFVLLPLTTAVLARRAFFPNADPAVWKQKAGFDASATATSNPNQVKTAL